MNTLTQRVAQTKNSFLLILLLTSCGITMVLGQSAFDSRTMLLSARGTALARSYVSEISEASCMLMNPASLSYLKDTSVIVNFYQELSNQLLSGNVLISKRFGEQHTVGLGIVRYTFRHYQYGIDVAYSYRVSPSFSAGILCQPRIGMTDVSNLYSTTFGLGIFYFPVPGIRYGFSILGIGQSLDLDPEHHDLIHTKQTRLVLGTSMNYPSWLRRPIMNLTASSESYLGANYFRYSIGLELFPVEMVALRLGFLAGTSSDPQQDHGLSGGFGIRLGIGSLDYGIGHSVFGKFHQISLKTQIGKII